MKKKTLKVIEEEEFRSDLKDYDFSFSRRIMVDVYNSNLKNKIPTNRMEIHEMDQSIIKEEYSKSKSNNSENENSSFYQSSSSLYKIKNHKQFK
jgi:hypothetical protein